MKMINEYVDGDHVNGQALVVSCNKGVTNNGLQYLNIELRDASASIGAKKWEITSEDESIATSGNIVAFEADVIKYKDNLQLKILKLYPLEDNEIDLVRFVKAPPVSQEVLIEKLNKYINDIKDEDYLKIIHYFIDANKDKFYVYPAGVAVHHEYCAGLLVHITSMLEIAKGILPIYPEIDKDLFYTGIILHDFGKLIELEGPVVYKYTTEGKLIGHISLMAGELVKCFEKLNIKGEKTILLRHMVLAHHGQYEYGSPVLPSTKEALLLSLIDNLDSKMVVCLKALETTKEGEFSAKVYPLDGRTIYKQHK